MLTSTHQMIPYSTFTYFVTGDFNRAVQAGQQYFNMTGPWSMPNVHTYQTINHQVEPSSNALQCSDCHEAYAGGTPRMDLQGSLGYTPKQPLSTTCSQCHDRENNPGFVEVHDKHVAGEDIACSSCHTFSRTQTQQNSTTKIGVYRPSTHIYYQDYNGNGVWDGGLIDKSYNFGISGDLPVSGDWNLDGRTEIGVYRPSTHIYYQDYNGNGVWDGGLIDKSYNFGISGDLPVSGDWNLDGRTEIGVYRPSTHIYYQDYNGNGVWNGAVTDKSYNFGMAGDLPASGDWNADGRTEIGVYRPSTHIYYQDYNGNGVWNGAVTDKSYNFGITGDLPVSGDWNNDSKSDIGIYRNSTHLFYLDTNGNGVWNGALVDKQYNFGIPLDLPATGNW